MSWVPTDYLTKPFNPKELVARVKAILRRADGIARSGVEVAVGSLTLNRQTREATLGDSALKLRTKEFDLLFALAQNLQTVMSREQLLSLVWGYTFSGETRTVDVHINHLRQHLRDSDLPDRDPARRWLQNDLARQPEWTVALSERRR